MKYISSTLLGLCLVLGAKAQVADSAARLVPVEGAINLRDVGGYATQDGKHVKWGRIYRSAAIDQLTDADMDTLAKRNIYSVVDFRGYEESAKAPDRLLPNTVYLRLPAGSDQNSMDMFKDLKNGEEALKQFYGKTDVLVPRYKPFFQQLLNLPDTTAVLYHCTAGKDRTGIATALLLSALDVPQEKIMEDYLASNVYRAANNKEMIEQMVKMGLDRHVAEDMAAVKPSYLEATFAAIQKQYGSVAKFLKNQLGLDQEAITRLKAKFTE